MRIWYDIPPLGTDILVTSLFLGGASIIFVLSLFSYMGLLPAASTRLSSFYSGKHVVITGGSSGIGMEIARILISAGASVTLVARNVSRLEAAAEQLQPPGESSAPVKRVATFSVDCSDPDSVERTIESIETQHGPIDILINSAGNAVGGYFDTCPSALIRQQIDANYFTQVYPSHAVFKRMATRRSGHIVLISSMAGQTGVFGQAAYSSAKFALRGLAEALYYEGRPFDINVTVAFPPDTDTPGLHAERSTMPPETLAISETGGLFSAEHVALGIAQGIMRNRFRVSFGVIGGLLGALTAGLTPGVSLSDIILIPIARAITPFFIWDQNSTIRRGHQLRFSNNTAEPSPK